MPRKVIIDCDPGIDDAVALTLALFDPRLEVVAVTAVAGNVPAEQATLNVQAIVERLDPPRYPRLGAATPPEDVPYIDARHLHGPDGLGDAGPGRLAARPAAPGGKADQRRNPRRPGRSDDRLPRPADQRGPGPGPRSGAARSLVGRIVIMGGSVKCIGNVTACAEFNIYCRPGQRPRRVPLADHQDADSARRDRPGRLDARPA